MRNQTGLNFSLLGRIVFGAIALGTICLLLHSSAICLGDDAISMAGRMRIANCRRPRARYCLPSSSYVIGPFPTLPMASCHSVAPSLVRNAITLPGTSPLNVRPGVGRQHAGRACAIADGMVPNDLSGLVIDGPKERLARNAIVRAGPAVGAVFGLEEIDAVAILSADDQQAGLADRSSANGSWWRRSHWARSGRRLSRALWPDPEWGVPSVSIPFAQFTVAKGAVNRFLPLVRSSTKK